MIAPLLIDSRGLLKLGFSLTLTAIFIFGGGFFVGVQQASAIQQVGNYTQALTLPVREELTESSIAGLPPETIVAGENIDVDAPEASPTVSNNSPIPIPVIATVKKDEQSVEVTSLFKNKDTQSKPSTKTLLKNSTSHLKHTPKSSVKNEVSDNSIIPAHFVTVLTSKQLSKIKYSVQVGMYGRLVNAENMVKMLQAQQFDAYITDYKNKKNEVRYNVRFGYFADKKAAIKRLKKFKDDRVGDGYLVKFSADNIVNLADTTAITGPTTLPTTKESANDNTKSGESPVKNDVNDISQNETFSTDALIQSVSN